MFNWLTNLFSSAPTVSRVASAGQSWIGPAVGAVSSMLGGALSYKGARRANEMKYKWLESIVTGKQD